MTREELKEANARTIEGIARLAKKRCFTGKGWSEFVRVLNNSEPPVLSVMGKEWSTGFSLQKFCTYNGLSFSNDGTVIRSTPPGRQPKGKAKDKGNGKGKPRKGTERDTEHDVKESELPPSERSDDIQQVAMNITPDTLDRLIAMLSWFEGRKDELTATETEASLELRPNFKRGADTQTITLRFGKALYERAKAEAKRQKALTGGTLNGFVEVLLWKALGCPKDLIDED